MYYQLGGTAVRLAGSMHFVPIGATLPQWIVEAYQWSEDLYLEANTKDAQKYVFLPVGESSQQRLPPALWETIKTLWPADHPLGPLGPQKLWIIATWLGTSGITLQPGVEHFIQERAKAETREIKYLETLSEFAQVMEEVSDADYAKGFALILSNDAEKRAQIISDIYAAWMSASVDEMVEIQQRAPLAQIPAVSNAIFSRRNLLWLPRIMSILGSNRRTVIFVGAGHLGGPQGLLELLHEQGVQHTPLI